MRVSYAAGHVHVLSLEWSTRVGRIRTCYIRPSQQVKRSKNLLVNDGDSITKFNLIELLEILQLTRLQSEAMTVVFTSWQQCQITVNKKANKTNFISVFNT